MKPTNRQDGDCCDSGANAAARGDVPCPACGTKGKAVKPITIESLVFKEARRRAGGSEGFRFCSEPSCEVAYFQPESGARITKDEVRVRIGQKAGEAPHPVCYCFEHTVEEIEAEVAATGTSRIPGEITEKCRQGLDRCEETNPQGSCCLGNVRRVVKEASPSSSPRPARNTGLWATAGAVLSAVLSSACCWLPLLLIAFGASAAGVSGFFEAYRPYLLGATGLLLASGFYLVYFRKETCKPGEACAVPNPRLRRLNKVMLWVAATAVLAFALFPNYVGYLLGGGDTLAERSDLDKVLVSIKGMTCEACASSIEDSLRKVPGVEAAAVSYDRAEALVGVPRGERIPRQAILSAIAGAGDYSGRFADPIVWSFAIEGMTCEGCASGLQATLARVPGVSSASVSYGQGRARVEAAPSVSERALRDAVSDAGYTVASAAKG